jgi:hypothetical protein
VTRARTFALTWDYRCPYARNVHEHVIAALEAGAPWTVRFSAFSLAQTDAEAAWGEHASVWGDPEKLPLLRANAVGIAARHHYPEQFIAVHRELFAAKHEHGGDLTDLDVVRQALDRAGAPAAAILKLVGEGWPYDVLRTEHETSVARHGVFGVPTFFVGDRAVFVRVMRRPADADEAVRTIERILDLIEEAPELNELKDTAIPKKKPVPT